MTLLIDTSAYSAFRRGLPEVKQYFTHEHDLLVPLVVIGELRAGFAAGAHQRQNETLLQQFLALPNMNMVGLSDATTQAFGTLYAQLRRAGTPIGQNDMWIAAIALEHGLSLVTLDRDFANVSGLQLAPVQI